ncbi:MAG: hypothetical protein L3J62_08435 [Gammaproteobacteria bacterium]|nr:hypothetical protein [Gammaproteobacteria bacterium]MCF6230801.1 hypothetical protein [Gammaproteobacteria bacterium]
MDTSSSSLDKKVSDISAWAQQQKESASLVDVKFCPMELDVGNVSDYIDDAYTMIKDYSKGNFKDCTNIIL